MGYLEKLIDDWPLRSSSMDLLRSAEDMLKDSRRNSFILSRESACLAVLEFHSLKHFGFTSSHEPFEQLANEAIALGVEFYYGDWKTEQNIIKWCAKQGWDPNDHKTSSEILRCSTVSDPSTLGTWRDTLSSLMLLCTMYNDMESLAKICDWFGANPRPEYSGLYLETEATTIVLASYFRSKPMEGLDKLVSNIAKCKRRYALVRLKLIQSCFDGNQAMFEETLPECLDLFYKSHKSKEPCIMTDLIAVDESTIVLHALKRGLALPKLSEKQQWALMSPKSVGIEIK